MSDLHRRIYALGREYVRLAFGIAQNFGPNVEDWHKGAICISGPLSEAQKLKLRNHMITFLCIQGETVDSDLFDDPGNFQFLSRLVLDQSDTSPFLAGLSKLGLISLTVKNCSSPNLLQGIPKSLKKLYLENCDVIPALPALPNLELLSITNCQLAENLFEGWPAPSLSELSLKNINHAGMVLEKLEKHGIFKSLRRIALAGERLPLDEKYLALFASAPSLKSMHITSRQIDPGVKLLLTNFAALRGLDLQMVESKNLQ